MAYKVTQNKSTQELLTHVMIDQTLEKITPWTANFTWAKWTQISDLIARASLVIYIFEWAEICTSTKALTPRPTLEDFYTHAYTKLSRESDEFRESSKRIASKCDVTFERYCTYTFYMCRNKNLKVCNNRLQQIALEWAIHYFVVCVIDSYYSKIKFSYMHATYHST